MYKAFYGTLTTTADKLLQRAAYDVLGDARRYGKHTHADKHKQQH
jgi:hypothetical protein